MNNLDIDIQDVVVEQTVKRSRGRPRKEQKPITDDELPEHIQHKKTQKQIQTDDNPDVDIPLSFKKIKRKNIIPRISDKSVGRPRVEQTRATDKPDYCKQYYQARKLELINCHDCNSEINYGDYKKHLKQCECYKNMNKSLI